MDKVDYYLMGETTVQVWFPNGEAACKWCWDFLEYDSSLRRCRCKRTGEPIPDPQHDIGLQCPLIFKEGETNGGTDL